MEEDEVKKVETDSPDTRPRRDLLRLGWAAVAGLAAGYSILTSEVNAAQTAAKAVTVRVPQLKFSGVGARRMLTADSRRQVLDSVAPVVSQIVEQSGLKLDSSQMAKLHEMLLTKGALKLPNPGAAAGYSLELTVSGMPAPGQTVRPMDD